MKSEIECIDKIIHGFHPQELVVIASRPGMGKTRFILSYIEKALEHKNSICYFSLDSDVTDSRLIIRNAYYPSVDYIVDEATNIVQHEDNTIKAVVIDFLQLIQDYNIEDKNVIMKLKKLAIDLNLPVILLSQVDKRVENRHNKRPMLSDLRAPIQIEDLSDKILFVYRKDMYRRREEETKEEKARSRYKDYKSVYINRHMERSEIIIAKNKTCINNISIFLDFNKEDLKFKEIDMSHIIVDFSELESL